jgi:hypothetical protein
MSWSIALLDSTLPKLPKECLEAIQKLESEVGEEFVYDGELFFNPDNNEWMDFLGSGKNGNDVIKILNDSSVEGRVLFGSLEGDNSGQFWGYEFKGGAMTKLTGELVWSADKKKGKKKK